MLDQVQARSISSMIVGYANTHTDRQQVWSTTKAISSVKDKRIIISRLDNGEKRSKFST